VRTPLRCDSIITGSSHWGFISAYLSKAVAIASSLSCLGKTYLTMPLRERLTVAATAMISTRP
jgi:hypothetical protein